MSRNVVGLVFIGIIMPVLVLAAPVQQNQAHKALLGIQATAPAKKAPKVDLKSLKAQRTALLQVRKDLRHKLNQGRDPAVRQQFFANRQQLADLNAQKGGK